MRTNQKIFHPYRTTMKNCNLFALIITIMILVTSMGCSDDKNKPTKPGGGTATPVLCNGQKCGANETCIDNECKPQGTTQDPCKDVRCENGEVCKNGTCEKPSTEENTCEEGNPDKQCPSDKLCSHGKCIDKCSIVKCKPNEVCVDGVCQAGALKSCDEVTCKGEKEVCSDGACVEDPTVCPDYKPYQMVKLNQGKTVIKGKFPKKTSANISSCDSPPDTAKFSVVKIVTESPVYVSGDLLVNEDTPGFVSIMKGCGNEKALVSICGGTNSLESGLTAGEYYIIIKAEESEKAEKWSLTLNTQKLDVKPPCEWSMTDVCSPDKGTITTCLYDKLAPEHTDTVVKECGETGCYSATVGVSTVSGCTGIACEHPIVIDGDLSGKTKTFVLSPKDFGDNYISELKGTCALTEPDKEYHGKVIFFKATNVVANRKYIIETHQTVGQDTDTINSNIIFQSTCEPSSCLSAFVSESSASPISYQAPDNKDFYIIIVRDFDQTSPMIYKIRTEG